MPRVFLEKTAEDFHKVVQDRTVPLSAGRRMKPHIYTCEKCGKRHIFRRVLAVLIRPCERRKK